MKFENKTAVITGGSRGIGLAIAKKLASQGANIAILYVGDESEGIAAKEALAEYNTKVEQYFCDVSDFNASKEVVDKVLEEFGGIDILVNNAGITRDKLVLNIICHFSYLVRNLSSSFYFIFSLANIIFRQLLKVGHCLYNCLF